MNSRNGPKIDLGLNLSPPRAHHPSLNSPSRSESVSPPTSCVSSELTQEEDANQGDEGPTSSMVLVGCPRCLMYVMLSEDDPKCPKCKSSVLLDFVRDAATKTARFAATGASTGSTASGGGKRTRKS